jgi:thiamine-monophosphate kinase
LLGRAPTVSDFTEAELVAQIEAQLLPAPDWLVVGIGDDAAVVEPERNRLEVLSVDALVEGVHFDRRLTPPDAIGHRALAVNLSDLAAMGAKPRLALLSLALPPDLTRSDFDAMVSGLGALAARHRLHLVGGNLTRSSGPLIVDVTVVGTCKRRQALTRRGARPGDVLYVTGSIGAAAAGLQMLTLAETSGDGDRPHGETCVRRYLYPEPRVRMGLLLARNRAASACMDLSDGLADAVHGIAEASGVGAAIDAGALPIDAGAREWFEMRGDEAVIAAMTLGDDYELAFAVPPRWGGRLRAASRHGDAPLTKIGVCTRGPGVVLQRAAEETPMPRGYRHFR